MHSDDGPALKYRDGYALYAVHGVRVPHWIIDAPETITTGKIDAEQNAEVRRVMTDRYRRGEDVSGVAAFLRDGGAELLDHDDRFGRLLRREVPGDEPIVLVHVLNPTPEPEGPLSEAQARKVFGDAAVNEALGNWTISPLYREGIEPRFKQYFLRVAPDLAPLPQGHWPQEKKREFLARQKPQKMTAKNAVASTWGKRGEDFNPVWRA
ncbi:MAG: hypothetical protein RBR34_08390 [Rhodospirillaceae bacterium]|nr:hypothetical protein [Rhodospirillaceae bacterium]